MLSKQFIFLKTVIKTINLFIVSAPPKIWELKSDSYVMDTLGNYIWHNMTNKHACEVTLCPDPNLAFYTL